MRKSRRTRHERPRVRKCTQNSEKGNPRPKEGKDPVKKASDFVALLSGAFTLFERIWEWASKHWPW